MKATTKLFENFYEKSFLIMSDRTSIPMRTEKIEGLYNGNNQLFSAS